jgi:glycosyltransferase involved in cell wall biosynthesis
MPLYCRRADAIITVSESSKRDIVEQYGLPDEKVTVVYEAAAPEFVPSTAARIEEVRQRHGLPAKFLLHVGTIEPRKNLTRLVEAIDRLRARALEVPLVVVGSKGWLFDDFFRRIEELDLRHAVLFTGYVPDRDLPAVCSAATAAVMPSVYEGFGLPVLEAMACGTPVLSSSMSSLPEVGGEAVRYFDPYDVADLTIAIREIWNDAELRRQMSKKGLEQASRFSWAHAARQTLDIYERVISSGV